MASGHGRKLSRRVNPKGRTKFQKLTFFLQHAYFLDVLCFLLISPPRTPESIIIETMPYRLLARFIESVDATSFSLVVRRPTSGLKSFVEAVVSFSFVAYEPMGSHGDYI